MNRLRTAIETLWLGILLTPAALAAIYRARFTAGKATSSGAQS